ncbi:centromere protein F isoform X1 [Callithrix jacchus]
MKSCKQLEEEMETLQKELSQLEAAQGRQKTDAAVPGPSPIPSATEKRLASDQNKASGKRQRSSGIWENGRGSTPSTPETFSKKSKKAVVRGIHPAEDTEDTEFELEGLSEVVNKGFADIPTGKTGPYILQENNHGNSDRPPPGCTEVSTLPTESQQRKSCRVPQTNSWWQQITKGQTTVNIHLLFDINRVRIRHCTP